MRAVLRVLFQPSNIKYYLVQLLKHLMSVVLLYKGAFVYPPRESVDSTNSSGGVRLCSNKNGRLHLSVRINIFQWNPVESTIPGGDKRTHP